MAKKMGKLKSNLGCLFQCFGNKKKAATDGDDVGMGRRAHTPSVAVRSGEKPGDRRGKKRVTIKEDSNRMQSPQSIPSMSGSVASGRSSVYFDASEGAGDDWHSLNGDGFDETFVTLQLDGQFFFNAKDDPSLSKEAFEGIHMYPPLPTTEPDPLPRSPISVSNIQTLLHTYQHDGDDIKTQKSNEEADIAAEKAGIALEHQAQRLLGPAKEMSPDYLGESTKQLLKDLKMPNVREKGFPGELNEHELEAVKLFQSELKTRDPIYGQIVRSLSMVEKEAYALCRWLRARKFDVQKVFELLDEAKEHYAKARECGFYPDLEKELGFSRPIFLSQYPAVFSGKYVTVMCICFLCAVFTEEVISHSFYLIAKNGCPVMYLKCGSIQPEGMKCIISHDKLDRFFWNDIMFAFPPVLKEGRRHNPNFVRTENITIYDLKGVSRSQITSDTFEMIKVGNKVMSSFPETLHCLLIINAPSWFGFVWSLVRKLIDPRTASKIEVFTSAKAGSKRMDELIGNSQIPSCYGGMGPSLAEAASGAAGASPAGTRSKMVVLNQLLSLSKKNSEKSYNFELEDAKQLTLTIYTRCKAGATAALFRADTETLVTEIDIVGEKEEPYSRTLGAIVGPGSFTVKIKAKSEPGSFLVLGTVFCSGKDEPGSPERNGNA
ncbi:hypothetical protein ACHAXR_012547 [Thalassiosira sp. AJA248-18]